MRSKREIRKMTEKLVPGTKEKLERAIKEQPDLNKLLNTELKNLPEKYWNIYDLSEDVLQEFWDQTLYEIILSDMSQFSRDNVFFSETESGELVGYASYYVPRMGDIVRGIFIISFDLNSPRRTMVKDFLNLIQELVSKYKEVDFYTNADSDADRVYIKALDRLKIPYLRQVDEDIACYAVYQKRFYEKVVKNKEITIKEKNK